MISKMKISMTSIFTLIAVVLSAQCPSWTDSPQKDAAENAHTIYRQALKTKDYAMAFENWQKAYDIAPAADGRRDYHFTDGALMYTEKFKTETDAAKKEEYKKMAIKLIDEAIACYEAGGISLKSCGDDKECYQKKIGYLQGRKAFDMYYTFNTPYSQTIAALKDAVDKSGNDVEYIVFDPYATIAVYEFDQGNLTKEETREIYQTLTDIADHNIANNKQYGQYYDQAKSIVNSKFSQIENKIFDCDYFIAKLQPQYDANPDDIETIKQIYAKLKKQGCDTSVPFVAELDEKWNKYVAAENARLKAEYEASNPGILAKKAYDAGDFEGAIVKYDEAIAGEEDAKKKAGYLFSKASIQFRKLKQYSTARATAREAAKLRPDWGRPYMLIGDMYGSTASGCGDAWNQRLAILAAIDKYAYARSIDSSVADEAGKRIGKYSTSKPQLADGFSRGIKEGQTVSVGCWIGEKVKVRFAK